MIHSQTPDAVLAPPRASLGDTLIRIALLSLLAYACVRIALPFVSLLLWSIVLGLVVFGDVPDLAMITGATIIIGSGLYALYRERVVGRRRIVAESTGPSMAPDGI